MSWSAAVEVRIRSVEQLLPGVQIRTGEGSRYGAERVLVLTHCSLRSMVCGILSGSGAM